MDMSILNAKSGDSHIKVTGMIVGHFERNMDVARIHFYEAIDTVISYL